MVDEQAIISCQMPKSGRSENVTVRDFIRTRFGRYFIDDADQNVAWLDKTNEWLHLGFSIERDGDPF
jgi:hypothetical protein